MSLFPDKPSNDVVRYLGLYAGEINAALFSVDPDQMCKAVKCLEAAVDRNVTIFVCGNGGSAAISNHLVCDHMKGVRAGTDFGPRVYSLSTNIEIVTAIANDIDYAQIFAFQLACCAKHGDVLIAISSSGSSPNIVAALEWARTHGMATIAMTGFDGGKSRTLADISLHVNAENYGVVEDVHQALMHVMAQFLRQKRLVDRDQIGKIKF